MQSTAISFETTPTFSGSSAPVFCGPPLFAHQLETLEFLRNHPRALVFSDPGTGKTRSVIERIRELRQQGVGPALVLAPKSILRPAWLEDIQRFAPELRVSVATAEVRNVAFNAPADIYVTNHDGAKWLVDNPWAYQQCAILVIDESTAIKHRTAQRSKATRKICEHFDYRIAMTGTPNPNGILDLWHQVYCIDDGEHLGDSFWRFRQISCEAKPIGHFKGADRVEWVDKPGIETAVADLLADITIRHKLDQCVDLPENVVTVRYIDLSPAHRAQYEELRKKSAVEVDNGYVTASNAAVRLQKLLQLLSGAAYDGARLVREFNHDRYELVADLVNERQASVVVFQWEHQRDGIGQALQALKLPYAVIDGHVAQSKREQAVSDFQAGKLRALLVHPQSAGHGLTLTHGVATIWASPTYNLEHFVQANRRIYRIGQRQRTETILIAARRTNEEDVYKALETKQSSLDLLLELVTEDKDDGKAE